MRDCPGYECSAPSCYAGFSLTAVVTAGGGGGGEEKGGEIERHTISCVEAVLPTTDQKAYRALLNSILKQAPVLKRFT